MANERDDESTSPTTGQESQDNEFGQQSSEGGNAESNQTMNNQGAEGSFGGESSGSRSGSADANGSSIAGGANAGQGVGDQQGGGMDGQPIGGNDSATGTGTPLTQGADLRGTTSNAGGSSVGTDQTSGGSSGVSGGEGFIGSGETQATDHGEQRGSDEQDFAEQGQGATDGE